MIEKPGLYSLPIDQYHGQPCDGPSFSKSALSTIIGECPAMYWAFSPINPKRLPQPEETAAQQEGRLVGAWILGDRSFGNEFVLCPFDSFRTKEARAWRDEQERTPVFEHNLRKARDMKAALMADPDIAPIFKSEHLIEQTVAWKEEHTGCGLWCLSRPDICPTDPLKLLRDYKRPRSINPESLKYWWADYGGDMQAAMALDGWKAVTGETRPGFANICQMPNPPYLAVDMIYQHEHIERGRQRYLAALEIAARCLETGKWNKYPSPDYYGTPYRIEKEKEEGYAPQSPGRHGVGEPEDPARYLAAV